jgi:hypothetical protein
MKKTGEKNVNGQLKLDLPSNTAQPNYNTGKVVNINDYSKRAFVQYIVKNSKSF